MSSPISFLKSFLAWSASGEKRYSYQKQLACFCCFLTCTCSPPLWKRFRHPCISVTLHTPKLVGHGVTEAQNSVPSPLSSPKKTSTAQIEIWSTRNQWSWGLLKEKCLSYFEPLWKQGTLHFTVAIGGPFENVVSCYCGPFESRVLTQGSSCWARLWSRVPAHSSCCWEPFESRLAFLHIAVAVGGPSEGRVLNHDVVQKIVYELIINFNQKWGIFTCEIPWGGPLERGGGKCLTCLPLNTPLYITKIIITIIGGGTAGEPHEPPLFNLEFCLNKCK